MIDESVWTPDLPDFRDQTVSHLDYQLMRDISPAEQVDLSEYFFSPEVATHEVPSVAISVGGLVEFFNRRYDGDSGLVSKPFIVEIAKRLQNARHSGDISIRTALKVISNYGVPPSRCVAATPAGLDPFQYSFRDSYANTQFFRVDAADRQPADVLWTVKKLLTLHRPCVFGFSVMSSLTNDARIDFRPTFDQVRGSSTGVIVGYDDTFRMTSKGAFMFRSTWGDQWGHQGYGWLDYKYLEHNLMRDIWTLAGPNWSD